MDGYTDFSTDVERVEQRVGTWCGAACAKMILDSFGVNRPQDSLFSRIFDQERFNIERLWSDPKGVTAVLNEEMGGIVNYTIDEFAKLQQNEILERLYYNAAILKLPSMVLIDGGGHWVVVENVRISETSSGDRTTVGYNIENPFYSAVSSLFVPTKEFFRNYMTLNSWGVTWKDKLVMISAHANSSVYGPRPQEVVLGGGGGGTDPTSLAILGMESAGFRNVRPITAGGGAPVTSPVRVSVLDTTEEYFIVPLDALADASYQDLVYVAVTPEGELLGSTRLNGALQILSDREAKALLEQQYERSRYDLFEGVFWKKSYFTSTRFDVFRLFNLDGEKHYLLRNGEIRKTLDKPDASGG